jgi:YcaO-like protein with predicted kinase domain
MTLVSAGGIQGLTTLATGEGCLKVYYRGTHRLKTPHETLESVRHLMPVMGITRIADITGLDTIGIPVTMVCRPNSRSLAVSQGKALELTAAKVSGLMESIEGYHAEHITLPLKLASYEELRYTHPVVDVRQLQRPIDSAFDPSTPLLWIEGFDVLENDNVWLPYELIHLNYTIPLPPGTGCFSGSSNGLASGNHLLEAISHGICEVIERDSVALWCLKDISDKQGSRVDLQSVDDSDCCEVIEKYGRAGVQVAVWDITNQRLPVPAFLCFVLENREDSIRSLPPAIGSGCHPCSSVALLRALIEAAQSRLTFISGSRDDLSRADYERLRSVDVLRRVRLVLEIKGVPRSYRDVCTSENDDLVEDVCWELQVLRTSGFDRVIVVDLTKPEFGVVVVRVVIPGLQLRTDHCIFERGVDCVQ